MEVINAFRDDLFKFSLKRSSDFGLLKREKARNERKANQLSLPVIGAKIAKQAKRLIKENNLFDFIC